jgi:hypothetical protein
MDLSLSSLDLLSSFYKYCQPLPTIAESMSRCNFTYPRRKETQNPPNVPIFSISVFGSMQSDYNRFQTPSEHFLSINLFFPFVPSALPKVCIHLRGLRKIHQYPSVRSPPQSVVTRRTTMSEHQQRAGEVHDSDDNNTEKKKGGEHDDNSALAGKWMVRYNIQYVVQYTRIR